MEKLPFDDEQAEVIDINNLAEIEPYFADKNINMDAPVNNRMASFLLVAAYFCKNIEVIKFLVKRGSSINKTDVFGFNAVMSVVLNENMEVDTKIKTIEFLADNGCDINWMTCLGETALTMALQHHLSLRTLDLDHSTYHQHKSRRGWLHPVSENKCLSQSC